MVETVFAIATLAGLYLLFRKAGTRGRTALYVKATGAILIAVPGLITLFAVLAGGDPGHFPSGRDTVLVPSGAAVEPRDARHFLVRGLVSAQADPARPHDYIEAVIDVGTKHEFEIAGGRKLNVKLFHDREDDEPDTVISLQYRHYGGGKHNQEAGPVRLSTAREIETGYVAFPKISGQTHLDRWPLGSLLLDSHCRASMRFLLTPLASKDAVDHLPAAQWWENHRDRILADAASDISHMEREWTAFSSGDRLMTGKVVSFSGVVLLLAGMLCLVAASPFKLRAFCWLLLYFVLYTGAVDSLALRIHTARLHDSDPDRAATAAVDVACSRMHPVSAAQALLDRAVEGEDEAVRAVMIRCLNRKDLLKALQQDESRPEALDRLADGDSEVLSRAARHILQRMSGR